MKKKLLFKLWNKDGQKYRLLNRFRESGERYTVGELADHLYGNRSRRVMCDMSRVCCDFIKDGCLRRKGKKLGYMSRDRKVNSLELTMKGLRILEYTDKGWADRELMWLDRSLGQQWLGYKYGMSAAHAGRIIRARYEKERGW